MVRWLGLDGKGHPPRGYHLLLDRYGARAALDGLFVEPLPTNLLAAKDGVRGLIVAVDPQNRSGDAALLTNGQLGQLSSQRLHGLAQSGGSLVRRILRFARLRLLQGAAQLLNGLWLEAEICQHCDQIARSVQAVVAKGLLRGCLDRPQQRREVGGRGSRLLRDGSGCDC
jgi:hypothetical protein